MPGNLAHHFPPQSGPGHRPHGAGHQLGLLPVYYGLQLLGWHTDQRSQPCPPSALVLGQKPQFDEAELGRGGRRR